GRCSACACYAPPAGPGTLVGFTPHAAEPSGFRFVVAEGTFVARDLDAAGTPAAAFRFCGEQSVAEAWVRWVGAGVTHHSAATRGHRARAIERLAHHLGVGCVVIAGPNAG